MKRVHLWISGYVQGVGFRYYTRREAQRLGVNGWVRNCPDGRVELVAEGDPEAVDAFVSWTRHGPSSASVEQVKIQDEQPRGEERFGIAG